MRSDDLYQVPADLPIPEDDGAARHLVGMRLPAVALPATNGAAVTLDDATVPLVILYCYPRTGRPDVEALGGTPQWNAIPGARGCTPQACGYRDNYTELLDYGAKVYGLSTQSTEYQREAVERLELPFPLLGDATGEFSSALRLPSFEVQGVRLLKRVTLIIWNGKVAECFYPVFPPDVDAKNVLNWIRTHAG